MATTAAATLVVKVISDTKSAVAGMDTASGRVGKFQSALNKAAIPAAIAGAAIIKFGSDSVEAASRLQQSMGGVEAVFGRNAGVVEKWAAGAATQLGLAKSEYGELASVIGAQLKNAGIPLDQATKKTGDLIKVGADLAATYGGTTKEAVEALGAALRGEADPAERYGLALSQTRVNAELAAKGQDKLTGAALSQAKAQAVVALATEQAGGAIGQFARESDSAAGSAQIAAAQWENTKATLGTALLPIVAAVTNKLAGLAKWMGENSRATQIIIGVVAALSAGILVLVGALKVYTIATSEATAANLKLMASLLTNPIFLIIAAIVALAVALVVAYKKSETFRNFVNGMWAGIKSAVESLMVAVNVMWSAVQAGGKVVANYLKALWGPTLKTLKVWWKVIGPVVKALWAVIKVGAHAAGKVVGAVFKALKPVVKAVTAVIKVMFKVMWEAIKTYAKVFVAYFKLVFAVIKGVVRTVMAVLRGDWRAAFAGLKSIVQAFKQFFVDLFHALPDPVQRVAETIKNALGRAFEWLRGKAGALGDVLSRPFNTMRDAVNNVIGVVEDLIGWLGKIHVPDVGSAISKLKPGFLSVPTVPAAPSVARFGAPTVGARASSGTTSGGGGVHITVNGALDPEATARQIRRILAGHDRRVGLSAS